MKGPRSSRRGGFTVVEMAISSFLMALMALLLSATWGAFCMPTIDAATRCRLAQEANLAADALARDFGGTLSESGGLTGSRTDGQFNGRMVAGPGVLRLCFHGGTSTTVLSPQWMSPDTVITYYLDGNQLIRWNEETATRYVAANLVGAFEVVPLEDGTGVTITLRFTDRDMDLTYTLVAYDPPKPY